MKWHLKFDSVVKEIDTYEGLRHVSVDLDAARQPMEPMVEPLESLKSFQTLPEAEIACR